MEAALAAIINAQASLQAATAKLCDRTSAVEKRLSPHDVLTKLTPDDEIDAYLELFERTAQWQQWPREEWGAILSPFLTGEAQKACRDLSTVEARGYQNLKTAILAQYGFSLPAKAQCYHQWVYNPSLPACAQITALIRQTHNWLEEGSGPSAVDRIILDRSIRALPHDAKRYVAQQCPRDLDTQVALLENHQVTQEMLRTTRTEVQRTTTPPPRTDREAPRKGTGLPIANRAAPRRSTTPNRPSPTREFRRCFREGHLARDCPERNESMATADATDRVGLPCHYLTTCWAHEGAPAPKFPVKKGGATPRRCWTQEVWWPWSGQNLQDLAEGNL